MWVIAASVATPLVILRKWLSKKCCKNIDEESDDDIQQTPPIPNPTFSPGQLSLVLLMVMHTPPSFITSRNWRPGEGGASRAQNETFMCQEAQLVQNQCSVW